jgi:hypothetical protein
MNKLQPVYIQGTPYLPLSSLSFDQTEFIKDWLSETDSISIEEDTGFVGTYVQYGQYDFWYENLKFNQGQFEEIEF